HGTSAFAALAHGPGTRRLARGSRGDHLGRSVSGIFSLSQTCVIPSQPGVAVRHCLVRAPAGILAANDETEHAFPFEQRYERLECAPLSIRRRDLAHAAITRHWPDQRCGPN